MPRISKKAKLLADLEKAILFEELLANSDSSDDEDERDNSAVALEPLPPLAVNGEGDVDSDDDIDKFPCFSDELCDWYVKVLLSRTVFPGIVLKKPITLSTMIESMREDAFKHFFRMVPCSFIALLAIIKDDAIFQNSSNNPQREVALQLLVSLYRFGREGNGSSVEVTAQTFNIAAGTVDLYTKRVIVALLRQEATQISWPNARRKRTIKVEFKQRYGMSNVVGVIDGTHFRLLEEPSLDGVSYYNRKGYYSYNVLLTCDHERRIIGYTVGYPGSASDSRIFRNSNFCQKYNQHFEEGEYLLADCGFKLEKYILTPYRGNVAVHGLNTEFNNRFAQARVVIEHVNGVLKARFQSLRGIRYQLRKKDDFLCVNRWIKSCLILHNFMQTQRDNWVMEEEDDVNSDTDDEDDGIAAHAIAAMRERNPRIEAGKAARFAAQLELLRHFSVVLA